MRVFGILRVVFARPLACEINLRVRVRVACHHTREDVNLLQVCTVSCKHNTTSILQKAWEKPMIGSYNLFFRCPVVAWGVHSAINWGEP